MTSKTDPLRTRWLTDQGRHGTLADEVLRRLVARRSLNKLGLPYHDGLLDLRYLPGPIPQPGTRYEAAGVVIQELTGTLELRKAKLVGLDLSGAELRSTRFHDSVIENCRFEKTGCQDWRLWATEVKDCSFARANFHKSGVGTWHGRRRNTWRRISFVGADFRVMAAWAAIFEDCDFSNAKLSGTSFEQCNLTRRTFRGKVKNVAFDCRQLDHRPHCHPMTDVDFTEARFADVEFIGTDLGAVKLPNDPDVRLIKNYRAVITTALDLLGNDNSVPSRLMRAEFENSLRMMRGAVRDHVFTRRDYLDCAGGIDLADFAEALLNRATNSIQ